MPEILVQISHRHLDRRNPMGAQQVEKLTARDSKQGSCLSLRKAALLEPAQDRSLPQFLWQLFRSNTKHLHGLFREFDCNLPRHGGKLVCISFRSNELAEAAGSPSNPQQSSNLRGIGKSMRGAASLLAI